MKQHSKFDNIENPPSLVNVVTDGHSDVCPSLSFVCVRATYYFTSFSTTILENVLRFLVAESSKSSKTWLGRGWGGTLSSIWRHLEKDVHRQL